MHLSHLLPKPSEAMSALGLLVGVAGFLTLSWLFIARIPYGVIPMVIVLPILVVSLFSLLWVVFRFQAWVAARGRYPATITGAWVLIQGTSTWILFRGNQGAAAGPINALFLLFFLLLYGTALRAQEPERPSQLLQRWAERSFLWGVFLGVGALLIIGGLIAIGSPLADQFHGAVPRTILELFTWLTAGALIHHWSNRAWPGALLALTALVAILVIGVLRHAGSTRGPHHLAWAIPLGLLLGTLLEAWTSQTKPSSPSPDLLASTSKT